jgi:steroid delta-isomerase-like uncharacterized protein
MAQKNVEALRAAHEAWNRRDFDGVIRNVAEKLVYEDFPRTSTLDSRQKFRQFAENWAKAFSDGRIVNPQYLDAGDTVIAQFTCEGTNDGPFAGLPPTNRRMSLQFCEIARFDKDGKVISGNIYYDQYTLLVQLGHVQPLAAAA